MSLISDIMAPGGGVMLLPFVRVVVGVLLILTIAGFIAGVARIHMAILSFLSAGLLVSLSVFESEYKKVTSGGGNNTKAGKTTTSKPAATTTAKTD